VEKLKIRDPMVEKQRINQFKMLRHGNVIAKMDAEIDLMMYQLNQKKSKQSTHHHSLIQAQSMGNFSLDHLS